MRILPPILSSVLLAVALGAPAANAVIAAAGDAPAATLLLPYFEVDPNDPNGTTLLTGMVKVNSDVDLYDQPGGSGNVIGMLSQGSKVPLAGCKKDGWCQVTGQGWVWGEFLDH